MLPVAAGQVGYPVALFILMKPDNRLLHETPSYPMSATSSPIMLLCARHALIVSVIAAEIAEPRRAYGSGTA